MSNSLLPRILYGEQEVRVLIFPFQESGKPEVLSGISSWNYTKDVIEFDQESSWDHIEVKMDSAEMSNGEIKKLTKIKK